MCRMSAGFLALALGAALLATPARAADPKFNLDGGKGDSAKPAAAKADPADAADKSDAAGKKDPLEQAFVLPKGVTLRPDQQKAFDKMRKDYKPKLKEALANVDKATADQEKTKAAHEALHVRQDIKAQIKNILAMPDPTANQAPPKQKRRNRWGYYNNN